MKKRAKLEADISFEIQQGNLGVEDKYAIMGIKNLSSSTKYLMIKKEKNRRKCKKEKCKKFRLKLKETFNLLKQHLKVKQNY